MRLKKYLIRFLISWLFLAPACYFILLPFLLHKLEVKVQTQNFNACLGQMRQPDQPQSPEADAAAADYCHCLTDGLTLDKQDLINILRKEPLMRLTEYVQDQMVACTDKATAAAQSKEPEVIYFNGED